MASLIRDSNNRFRVSFTCNFCSRRCTIYTGKMTKRDGEFLRRQVELLAASRTAGVGPAPETVQWLDRVGDDLRNKLARHGLCSARINSDLGTFLDTLIEQNQSAKHWTKTNMKQAVGYLVEFFGNEMPLRAIDTAAADRWLAHMQGRDLAVSTIRRATGRASQYFGAAQDRRLIRENPFKHLPKHVPPNRERDHFVSHQDTQKVLDACPNALWRCLVALCRYGGLRCPSETIALRWTDVNWAQSRFTVRSSKTEHHAGGAERSVPLFPELLPHFRELFEQAEEGAVYVMSERRSASANFRTQLHRIIRRAGLQPWPKVFQNLRASRATELADEFPSQVAAAWLGHSEKIADANYRQVTEDHFARAAGLSSAALTAV